MEQLAWGALLVLVGVGTWVNVPLLLWVWVKRLRHRGGSSLRHRIGWLALVLASLAVVCFWSGIVLAPSSGSPRWDTWYAVWLRICCAVSFAVLLAGVFGRGRNGWAVVLSAVITPMSCVLQKVLE